ncbi:AraC family transcriptional regulator [Flexithrix dorotheae]|uniref:AraC family transcriptional regulator n=1 Tax=Flexithrix dorotheae TaxID=70993 RepID=UPI0003636774|nr:AraC family transcriptional regulator [Flexithrix dorotheae]
MKFPIQKSAIPEAYTFEIHDLKAPFFDPNWHFHPEYQLFVVMKGSGTRFIGDNIKHFQEGDMVFTGPNLPHLWRSDDIYFHHEGLETHGIVIYFSEQFMGKEFLKKKEMEKIKQLFEGAERGLEFLGGTNREVTQLMRECIRLKGFDRVIALMQILNALSLSKEFNYISSLGYLNTHSESDSGRMQKVYDYVMKKFKEKISLDDVSSLINMSPSSFSRYFKSRANKTFSDFVIEIRIGYACKLLLEGNLSVTQIAYECGFRTLSNFNRKFKEINNNSPLGYKKEFSKVISA